MFAHILKLQRYEKKVKTGKKWMVNIEWRLKKVEFYFTITPLTFARRQSTAPLPEKTAEMRGLCKSLYISGLYVLLKSPASVC